MDQHFRKKNVGKPRILVAPLDWGLGHATRCIPIIRELIRQNCDVWLAGEAAGESLLRAEFPGLPFLQLSGYHIQYARSGRAFLWKMIMQLPKMNKAIRNEHEWLKAKVNEYDFDAIISDNRYGLYHATIPSIFITHQLWIKSPLGKWTGQILQQLNHKYINRFKECWVPDLEGVVNFAGALSHPAKKPGIPVRYVGILSRFKKDLSGAKKNHLLIILSGPEPQRSIMENKIITEISHYNGTATVVRGLPGSVSVIPSTNMIKFYNHLPADELNKEMTGADYVISRSGYSTVMDIITLQKKSILIPTPRQPEQEYLAAYLMEKGMAFTRSNDNFSLELALKQAHRFSYTLPVTEKDQRLQKIISTFVNALENKSGH